MAAQRVAGPCGPRAIFYSTAGRGQWAASSHCMVVRGPPGMARDKAVEVRAPHHLFIYLFTWVPAPPTAVAELRPSELHYPSKCGVSGANMIPWGWVAVRREDIKAAGPSPGWLLRWEKIQLWGSHNQEWMGNVPQGSWFGKAGAGPGFP